MNPPAWRIALGSAVAALALLALRAGSLVAVRDGDSARAWVRLSWSARPERIERCRRLSDAELEELPEHMRLREECTGHFAQYVLQLSVDGHVVRHDTVRGGGFRRDRPMHVLGESPLDAGTRHVVVSLTRLDSAATSTPQAGTQSPTPPAATDREEREHDERLRRAEESVAPSLTLDTTLTLRQGQVLLITYDGVRRTLAARSGSE